MDVGMTKRQSPWPAMDSRHMGAWTGCRVVTYASIRLSLSATTPWDEDEGSTLRGKLALGPREVARRHGILSPRLTDPQEALCICSLPLPRGR